ncbi:MAG: hypothetical protein P4M11_08950 [Candidatus Pacebacteria bacterium]|nr:hypothetical protein [Candidatus Paceibacterota bacterium]
MNAPEPPVVSQTATRAETPEENGEHMVTEGLLSLKRGIFSPARRHAELTERFDATAQEYLEKHKIAVYLQDAIKILIERKDERPTDLLTE